MNSSKIIFVVALIAISCITFSESLKCHTCDTTQSCKKPKSVECNSLLANNTRSYLDLHHVGVNTSLTSSNFDCFREDIKSATNEYKYKGCTYSNIAGCSHVLRDFHTIGKYSHYCNQCNSKDGCNPAGRAGINLLTVLATIVAGVFASRIWF